MWKLHPRRVFMPKYPVCSTPNSNGCPTSGRSYLISSFIYNLDLVYNFHVVLVVEVLHWNLHGVVFYPSMLDPTVTCTNHLTIFFYFWSLLISYWRRCTSLGTVCSWARHSFKMSRKSIVVVGTLAIEATLDGSLDIMWCDLWDAIYESKIYLFSVFPITEPIWSKNLFAVNFECWLRSWTAL